MKRCVTLSFIRETRMSPINFPHGQGGDNKYVNGSHKIIKEKKKRKPNSLTEK